MKNFGIVVIAASVLLSACGGRSDGTPAVSAGTGTGTSSGTQNLFGAGGQSVNGGTGVNLGAANQSELSVRVISDRNNIPTGGTDVATITALVTNDKNQALAGQSIDVSSTGGVLQNIDLQTNENGEAKATLALAQDYQNQNIDVTVSAGSFSGTVQVAASGSEVSIAGPDALVLGDNAEMTITLTAGNSNPIANREIALTSANGSTVTPESAFTDADGRIIATVSNISQDDTITATALTGTASATYSFKVAADILAFDQGSKDAEFAVGTAHEVTATWIAGGQPVVGKELRFAITAGQLATSATQTTNAAGEATVSVISSSAGPATVSVEDATDGDPATQTNVEFVATTAAKVLVDSSSSRVHTEDTSTITALVTDINGNPVKNKEVVFTSADLKGGQLNPASAVTDSAGEASVTFTAGDQATTANEIEVVAEVLGTSINSRTDLTVVKRVLNVTIGSSNVLKYDDLETQYRVAYVVQVADGGGAPLADADVELSIEPVSYRKGWMVLTDKNGMPNDGSPTWQAAGWRIISSVQCDGEDINGNRSLDTGEDTNNNGNLDPQDPALLAPAVGSDPNAPLATLENGTLSTDTAGSGYFNLVYPVSNALWSTVRITARAQALGTEATDTYLTSLPMDATKSKLVDIDPPNEISPYGIVLVDQLVNGVNLTPCQNVN